MVLKTTSMGGFFAHEFCVYTSKSLCLTLGGTVFWFWSLVSNGATERCGYGTIEIQTPRRLSAAP